MKKLTPALAALIAIGSAPALAAPVAVPTVNVTPLFAAPDLLVPAQVPVPVPPPQATMNRNALVIGVGPGGRLSLRAGPGTGFPRLNTIPEGSAITVLAQNGNWFWVRTGNGMLGYASSRYIRFTPGTPGTLPPVPRP